MYPPLWTSLLVAMDDCIENKFVLFFLKHRNGSVIADFTINYTEISTSELLLLQSNMDETGYLGSLPVTLKSISALTGNLSDQGPSM